MKKNLIKAALVISFSAFVISFIWQWIVRGTFAVGAAIGCFVVAVLIITIIVGFALHLLYRYKPIWKTQLEETMFFIEKTPMYGLVVIAGTIIFFNFLGVFVSASFCFYFGLSFASPWSKDVQEIAREWMKSEKD